MPELFPETNLLLCVLFGGIVSSDTEAAWQIMISQPLAACTVAGVLLGNITLGLTFGLVLQLPFLAEVPAGGTNLSMSNLGSYVAAMLAVGFDNSYPESANTVFSLSVLLGIILSWGSAPTLKWLRFLNLKLVRQAECHLQRLTLYNYLGVLSAFLFGCIFTGIFFLLGVFVLDAVLKQMPAQLENALVLTKPVLLGAGFGVVILIFVNKKTKYLAVTGVLICALILFLVKH